MEKLDHFRDGGVTRTEISRHAVLQGLSHPQANGFISPFRPGEARHGTYLVLRQMLVGSEIYDLKHCFQAFHRFPDMIVPDNGTSP